MAPQYIPFWLPSRDNEPGEYQDAFAADPGAGRFAVADGASESGFADLWARLLVDDFVAHPSTARGGLTCGRSGWPAVMIRWR